MFVSQIKQETPVMLWSYCGILYLKGVASLMLVINLRLMLVKPTNYPECVGTSQFSLQQQISREKRIRQLVVSMPDHFVLRGDKTLVEESGIGFLSFSSFRTLDQTCRCMVKGRETAVWSENANLRSKAEQENISVMTSQNFLVFYVIFPHCTFLYAEKDVQNSNIWIFHLTSSN